MSDLPKVAIFWDYENCSPPSNSCGLGYDIVNNIRRIARLFGSVTTFRAYLDISAQSPKSLVLRSELQSSGVSIIDCPHNGKKDVVDKMILVDMLAFAIDHPTPATVMLITGDRDYAYAVSILKLRKYHVILVLPSSLHVSPCLESQASLVIDWGAAILRNRTDASSTQPVRQPYLDIDPTLVATLLAELQDPSADDPNATASQSASRLRRISARDLLEPTRHSKSTGSVDSTHEFASLSSAGTLSDPALGGSPVPRTPSRSQHTSVSVQARAATVTLPTLEHQIPAKNPPFFGTGGNDDTAVASPTKGDAALPPLDAPELPFHDNRPSVRPSSLESTSQPTDEAPVTEKPGIPSSRGLNCLASPFVTNKAPTGLGSTPCARAVKPTTPIVAPTRALADTTAYETLSDVRVSKPVEHLTGPRSENDDTSSERSGPYRVHPKATNSPKPNHRPYFASPTMDSPLSRGAGLRPLDDTPLGKHASPPVMFLGVVDDDDSAESSPSSRASSALDHSAPDSLSTSSAVHSDPFATGAGENENERRQKQAMFKPLIQSLFAARERGITRSPRSDVAQELQRLDKQVYQRAGVLRFRDYATLAEHAGVVQLGGREGDAWIALHPNWFGTDDITTIHTSRVSSPVSGPPVAIQNPSLTGFRASLMDWAASLQPPTAPFPRPGPLESGNEMPTLATGYLGGAPRIAVPVQFQPLIDVLVQMRIEGSPHALRSLVGQALSQDVYVRAGVLGFREYVQLASQAHIVQCGGVGGHAWIRLHPELRT